MESLDSDAENYDAAQLAFQNKCEEYLRTDGDRRKRTVLELMASDNIRILMGFAYSLWQRMSQLYDSIRGLTSQQRTELEQLGVFRTSVWNDRAASNVRCPVRGGGVLVTPNTAVTLQAPGFVFFFFFFLLCSPLHL